MWTTLKNLFCNLVAKLTRKPVCNNEPESNHQPDSNPEAVKNGPSSATKDKKFDGARMSENRLQALDGTGYRQCYMEKIRQVASDSEPAESNREYWFGRDDDSASDWPAVTAAKPGTKPGTKTGTTSNTRLPSSAEQAAGTSTDKRTASGANQELTQSGSRIPGIIKAIPSRARVTSTQLQAYVESLPKPEE
jgi:hypothetical protein